MYTNNAYLHNTLCDIKDKSKPLIVTSCGTYHLYMRPLLPTWRPRGRLDFQLLYIASGKAHFHFGDKEEIVTDAISELDIDIDIETAYSLFYEWSSGLSKEDFDDNNEE